MPRRKAAFIATKTRTYKGAVVNYANNGVANAALAELVRVLAKTGVNIETVTDSRMVQLDTKVVVLVDEVPDEIANTLGELTDHNAFFVILNHRAVDGAGWAKLHEVYGERQDFVLLDIAAPNTTQDITFIGGVVEAMWDIEAADKLSAWQVQQNS